METVVHSIALTKRHKNVDFAYYAGESAIENWFSVIEKEICNKPKIGWSYPGTLNVNDDASKADYSDFIIKIVKNSGKLVPQLIDIAGVTASVSGLPASTSAKVSLVGDPEYIRSEWNTSTKMLDIYIGIKANSTFSTPNTSYNAGNKEVYARKAFSVAGPFRPQLESAIWAIGDVFIDGNDLNKTTVVKGDVFNFGSYPKKVGIPNQEYFGGIYAIDNGKLNIYGNAYSRSFIRTGPYFSTDADNSEIRIYKDAIAECLQDFGNNDKIIALRNAYTFDDVEINGDDSVIAINGSLFGLSTGGSTSYHDNSSAIVNSAIVHSLARNLSYTQGSFRSRVTINGDVILGGSTFKTNDDGTVAGLIEDASIAFDTSPQNELPYYRVYSDGWTDATKYHMSLRNAFNSPGSTLIGYLNQFQVWDMVSPYDPAKINDWIGYIDTERNTTVGTYNLTPPSKIRGWSRYETVANNKIYMCPLGSGFTPYEDESTSTYRNDFYVLKGTLALGSYKLDNIFDATNKLQYGGKYWDGDVLDGKFDATDTMLGVRDELFGDGDPTHGIGLCGNIHNDLLDKVNRYTSRKYPVSGDVWATAENTEFNDTLKAIETKYGEVTGVAKDHMLYISNSSAVTGDHDIDELFHDQKAIIDPTSDIRIYAKSAARVTNGGSDYYIIANEKPDVNLVINNTFNGIIVTAGKVILKEGASVYGSIIAAGDGYYSTGGTFYPKAKEINNDIERANLDKGDYAAVKVIADPAATGDAPYVDFFLGFSGGRTDYSESGLMNVITTATSSPAGSFLIPTGVSTTEDKLNYLNKAARINLLNKFLGLGINLYDIF